MTEILQNSSEIPPIRDEDPLQPLAWLERLSDASLMAWLRSAIWIPDPLPVIPPHTSDFAVYLAHLVGSATTEELKIRLRRILPDLLREWGRRDPARCLVQLLILSGHLRCVAAEPAIVAIARERIEGHSEEVDLRRRCLSTLSGFGCTERTLSSFLDYINDIEYSAVCYRALYRFDLSYASSKLPTLIKLYKNEGVLEDLIAILDILFNEYLKPVERVRVFKNALVTVPKEQPNEMEIFFDIFNKVGIRIIGIYTNENDIDLLIKNHDQTRSRLSAKEYTEDQQCRLYDAWCRVNESLIPDDAYTQLMKEY